MNRVAIRAVVGSLLIAALGAACSGQAAVERLRAALADYASGKPAPTEPEIDALFAQVDADIAVLRAKEAANPETDAGARAAALQRERLALSQTYLQAKMERLRGAAENVVRDVGKQVGQGLEAAGRRIQESMQTP